MATNIYFFYYHRQKFIFYYTEYFITDIVMADNLSSFRITRLIFLI